MMKVAIIFIGLLLGAALILDPAVGAVATAAAVVGAVWWARRSRPASRHV
jgi:hypothetical protein